MTILGQEIIQKQEEIEHNLDLADHATKGATSARSKLEPMLKFVHPDEQVIELSDDEYKHITN